MRSSLLLSAALAAGFVLTYDEGSAHAGGFSTARFGADHGHPAVSTAYAVYYNPAAMGGATGTQITLDGTFAIRNVDYTRNAVSPGPVNPGTDATYLAANTGKAHASSVLASPFLGVTTDFGLKGFRFGYATYVPFGGSVKWDQNSAFAGDTSAAGRAGLDGPQRWHSISGRVTALYNTLALAYRIEPIGLSFGVSGSLVLNNVESTRARNINGSDDVLGPNGALVEGRSYLKVSSVNFAMSAGVHWEPLPNGKLRLGASYLMPPNFGEFRMKGEMQQVFGSDRIPPPKTDVEFLQKLPDIIRIGVASRFIEKAEVRADATYERWSVVKSNCVVKVGASCNVDSTTGAGDESQIILNLPREWKDSFSMRLGGSYWFNQPTELFGSFGFGTSAIPKARMDVSAFDSTQVFFTLGVKREFIRGLLGALSLNYIHYVPVTVAESQLDRYQSPSKSPSANGAYDVRVYYLNANVTYKF